MLTYQQAVGILGVNPTTVTRWGGEPFLRRYRPLPDCRLHLYSAVDVLRILGAVGPDGRTPDRRVLHRTLPPGPPGDGTELIRLGVPATERVPLWVARGQAVLAAETLFGLNQTTVARWASSGRLRAFAMSGVWFYHAEDVHALAVNYGGGAGAEPDPTAEAVARVILDVVADLGETLGVDLGATVARTGGLAHQAALKILDIAERERHTSSRESTIT